MSNPFDYFERIFCINRDCRPERWTQVKEEFAKLGIEQRVERFPGIEDSEDPERGCMKAHKACAAKAHAEGARNMLVFEDDIKICETDEVAQAIYDLRWLPWRMFYLGGYPSRRQVHIPTGALRYGPHLCRLIGGYLCGHAYAVNSELFPRYSQATQPIDRWYAYTIQPTELVLVVRKFVVGQQSGYSDLRKQERSRGFMVKWHNRMIRRAE